MKSEGGKPYYSSFFLLRTSIFIDIPLLYLFLTVFLETLSRFFPILGLYPAVLFKVFLYFCLNPRLKNDGKAFKLICCHIKFHRRGLSSFFHLAIHLLSNIISVNLKMKRISKSYVLHLCEFYLEASKKWKSYAFLSYILTIKKLEKSKKIQFKKKLKKKKPSESHNKNVFFFNCTYKEENTIALSTNTTYGNRTSKTIWGMVEKLK